MTERPVSGSRVRDLSQAAFGAALRNGLGLQLGPFRARLKVSVPSIVAPLHALYADYSLVPDDSVFSFHARLDHRRSLPRLYRRRVRFSVDGQVPHEDMPRAHALPVLEWGINLVIAMRAHAHLMLHSAAVELDGSVMMLPAAPGAGKSTLCAALAHRGWRLFSDEFGLVRPDSAELIPLPRPIALKNESIDVVRERIPEAHIGPSIEGTRKGTVAHVRPPRQCIERAGETAPARWIVFPRWEQDAPCVITEIARAKGFMLLATNAFNYDLLGEPAFRTVSRLVDDARCFEFVYSDLDDAVAALTDFVRR